MRPGEGATGRYMEIEDWTHGRWTRMRKRDIVFFLLVWEVVETE